MGYVRFPIMPAAFSPDPTEELQVERLLSHIPAQDRRPDDEQWAREQVADQLKDLAA